MAPVPVLAPGRGAFRAPPTPSTRRTPAGLAGWRGVPRGCAFLSERLRFRAEPGRAKRVERLAIQELFRKNIVERRAERKAFSKKRMPTVTSGPAASAAKLSELQSKLGPRLLELGAQWADVLPYVEALPLS
jgi:hypothetical protein